MDTLELFLIAVGLSMDAFAVSVCQGLSTEKINYRKALIIGLYFGGFQAMMPVLGYFAGLRFSNIIDGFDEWIAFALMAFIGAKMIGESLKKGHTETKEISAEPTKMLPLAIATSIDALAVGVSFALLQVKIIPAASFIGVTTLVLSMIGFKIGNIFGMKFKSKAELVGGVILIFIGLKILLS